MRTLAAVVLLLASATARAAPVEIPRTVGELTGPCRAPA